MSAVKSSLSQTLATNIRDMRKSLKLTQEQMAKTLGMSTPAYSKIETQVTDVNLSRLAQIADIFDVKLTQLLGNKENPNHAYSQEISDALKKIADYETEIIDLQRKVISLYERKFTERNNRENGGKLAQ